jgi:hypothetical protein
MTSLNEIKNIIPQSSSATTSQNSVTPKIESQGSIKKPPKLPNTQKSFDATTDLEKWFLQLEHNFLVCSINESDKVNVAGIFITLL